jgi:tetratricopeptide (TPR) repeat protein
MFRRVLSANPEDMIAWVGLSEVYNKHNELDAAVWYLERAFELSADTKAIEEALRQLYSRRDGAEVQKAPLTPGALARLYLKGDLLSRAISDFRALLSEHPERADLQIALAEALWRNDQRLEASEVCQKVLDELPYCLKANLILGNIWISSGREEGQAYLRRAQALDPENRMAQDLFGDESPLSAQEIQITPLTYKPVTEQERPEWMAEVESVSAPPPLTDKEAALVDITAALEAQIEIPSWLEDIAIDEEPPASVSLGPAESPGAQMPGEAEPAPVEAPAWLAGVAGEIEESPAADQLEPSAEEGAPEWLAGLGGEPIGDEGEAEGQTPEWLSDLGIDAAGEAPPASAEGPVEETPEWVSDLGTDVAGEAAPAPVEGPAETPEWLSGLDVDGAGEAPPASVEGPAETPEWLSALDVEVDSEAVPPVASPAEEAPDWLSGLREQFVEESPATDEPLAEPPIVSGVEGAVPSPSALLGVDSVEEPALVDETFGWTSFDEPESQPEPALPVEEAPLAEAPAEEAPAPAPAEIPDWMQDLAPSAAQPEAALPVEEAAVAEEPVAEEAAAPAWLEGDVVPSGDEALAWLEQLSVGKEDELQAQIAAESESRMAEIMGRSAPAEPPPEQAPPTVELPVAEAPAPAPAEIPDWMQELAPAAAQPEAAVPAEQAPSAEVPAEEPPAPAWLEGDGVPSGDEALAWLEQLAAGKEDELQAQIEAESESRMAEIMGRSAPAEPAPAEAAPVAEQPVTEAPAPAHVEQAPAEETPVAEEAAAPAWLEGDGVPSGDEALAWLEQLAAGKEDELQAQIEAESESRMAEIMGRSAPAEPAPAEAAPVVEQPVAEAPAPAPVEEAPVAEAPVAEVPAPAPPAPEVVPEEAAAPSTEEMFGWTAFGEPEAQPEVPLPAQEEPLPEPALPGETQVPSDDEALAFLEQMTESKEELLRAQIETEADVVDQLLEPLPEGEVDLPPDELEKIEEAITSVVEEVFGWSSFGDPEAVEPPDAVLSPAEPVPSAPPVAPAPPPPAMEVAPTPPAATPPAVMPPETAPPKEAAAPPKPPAKAAPPQKKPTVDESEAFAAERAYLKQNPRDYEAWLALAQAMWQANEREGSLEAYSRVIRSGRHLDMVIQELEAYLRQWDDASTRRVLGDAYMKDGRLQKALDLYRQALDTL